MMQGAAPPAAPGVAPPPAAPAAAAVATPPAAPAATAAAPPPSISQHLAPSPPPYSEEESVLVYETEPPPDDGGGAASVVLYGLLVLAILLVLYFALLPGRRRGRREDLTLAEELAFAGWVYYGRPGCPWCARQLEALGTNAYPRTVTCSGGSGRYQGAMAQGSPPIPCSKIGGFPFWANELTGATRKGYQNEAQLADMAERPASSI